MLSLVLIYEQRVNIVKAEVLHTDSEEQTQGIMRPNSMDEFIRSTQKMAYRIAFLSTRNREDALDVVQDTIVKLIQNYRGKPVDELKPLLFRILNTKLTDWHRKRIFRSKFHRFLGTQDDDQNLLENIAVDLGLDVEQTLEHERDMVELLTALSELSERQRQVVILRHWQGFSVQETADILNCSQGSIKTHLHRALNALQSNTKIIISGDDYET